jgi:hypothetical protein
MQGWRVMRHKEIRWMPMYKPNHMRYSRAVRGNIG